MVLLNETVYCFHLLNIKASQGETDCDFDTALFVHRILVKA